MIMIFISLSSDLGIGWKEIADRDPLELNATVSSLRHDVDYVVTQYGIASLRGKNPRERAQALTEIAHPSFRETLDNESLKFLRVRD